jgi:Tfp pilus assembly protein PilN
LPPNVRFTSFRTRLDARRGNVVTITLVARSVDDVDKFMANLEGTGSFPEILPPTERANERGQIDTAIEAVYAPRSTTKAAAVPTEPGAAPR